MESKIPRLSLLNSFGICNAVARYSIKNGQYISYCSYLESLLTWLSNINNPENLLYYTKGNLSFPRTV